MLMEIVVRCFQCEILITRPGHKSVLRIRRSDNHVISEIAHTEYCNVFTMIDNGILPHHPEKYTLYQLRELYRDYIPCDAN